MTLSLASVTEAVTVTAESPLVDVTSAARPVTDITLDLLESLPTGAQLPELPPVGAGRAGLGGRRHGNGNPASRSGTELPGHRWRSVGVSRDNFYYIEGINVTDPCPGTFGANLNTEIIQEQNGHHRRHPGRVHRRPGPGLERGHQVRRQRASPDRSTTSSRTTPRGRQREPGETIRSRPTTPRSRSVDRSLGTRLWFFASFRRQPREHDVTAPDATSAHRRRDERAGPVLRQGHVAGDSNEPRQRHLSRRPADRQRRPRPTQIELNSRDDAREQGGDRYIADLPAGSGVGGDRRGDRQAHAGAVAPSRRLDASATTSSSAAPTSPDARGRAARRLRRDFIDERDSEFAQGPRSGSSPSPRGPAHAEGRHQVRGAHQLRRTNLTNDASFLTLTGDDGRVLNDAPTLRRDLGQGMTAADPVQRLVLGRRTSTSSTPATSAGWSRRPTPSPRRMRSRRRASGHRRRRDDHRRPRPRSAMVFDRTTGNPNGMINYDRDFQVQAGRRGVTKSEGTDVLPAGHLAEWQVVGQRRGSRRRVGALRH